MRWRENSDWRRQSLANSSSWPWRRKKKEEQNWRMMQLPEQLRLAMEMDKERKATLATTQPRLALEISPIEIRVLKKNEGMSSSKQFSWPWRRKKKEEQDWRMMQLPNGSGWPWRWMKKEKQDRRRW